MAPKSWLQRGTKCIATGFDLLLHYEFDVLDEHRKFAEKSLSSAIKSLEKRINRDIAIMDAEERDAYYDYIHDEYVNITEILPRIQWNSQFLVVYSTFEYSLNKLCRIVQRRSGFNLSFKDLSGQGIERAKNYLSKVAGVKEPFESPNWGRAVRLRDLRNAIAHTDGEIELASNDKKSLGTWLVKEKYLQLKQVDPDQKDAQIILTNEFVRNSIKELRDVVVSICDYELYGDES